MRKLIIFLLYFSLVGCSANPPEDIATDEAYSIVAEAIEEMGDNTDFEIVDSGINDDERYYIMLSDNTGLFIKDNQVYAANDILASETDIKQSFELAMAIANPDLNMGERNLIYQDVMRDGVSRDDDATYRYHERDGSILLEVDKK